MPLYAYLQARLAEIRDDGERGDSPVPTAVIIMGLVLVAMAVTAAAWAAAEAWMGGIPAPTSPGGP
jgi:hypothetical protein